MANQHKHSLRGIRQIPDDDWNDLATAAEDAGTDRSAIVSAYIRWHLRRPGAQLPERPPATPAEG